ncbi:MAG: FtsW/RodA/SpoVE family cell cycle protein, partial [Methylobacteriaceae bacterium]|nr:FtsW/RodA/SpoVE family cell cycle protein [Methylobacteriaceae bacterium]
MVSRTHRSPFADWWWTVDRWLLGGLGVLMVVGVVLTMAASPPVAERLGLSTFHFVHRQVLFLGLSAVLLIVTSFLSPRHVRRAALLAFLIGMALVAAGLLFGQEVKGSRRWILGIQPSEFVKPCFVVLAAWAFAEGGRRRGEVPGNVLALLLLPATIVPLILQPDFGQTMLISLVWATLFFMAGLHWFWVAGIGGVGAIGALLAYELVPHVRARILQFIDSVNGTGTGDRFQVDTALDSIVAGGWFGKGPGEGTLKRVLPDAHTDFTFAVTGEEFGILACIGVMLLFGFIVLRGLLLSARNEDPFCRFTAAGLVMLFGLQSL